MIDLKFLRENPDVVRASQRTRGEDPGLVDVLLEADSTRRAAVLAGDQLRAEQKALGKRVGKASPEDRPALLAGASELAAQVKAAEAKQHEADAALDAAQRALSNIVEDGAPAGGEEDFVLLETVGEIPTFEFEPKDHLELGESLNLIDMERGAKVSGSRSISSTVKPPAPSGRRIATTPWSWVATTRVRGATRAGPLSTAPTTRRSC